MTTGDDEGFVLTPEYIQDSMFPLLNLRSLKYPNKRIIFAAIKNVLRQGNLNPEIEEKLLTLQRYQEKQSKGDPFEPISYPTTYSTRPAPARSAFSSTLDSDEFEDELSDEPTSYRGRKRGYDDEDDDDEWVLDSPRKYIKKADREKMEQKKGGSFEPKKYTQEETTPKIVMKPSNVGHISKNNFDV